MGTSGLRDVFVTLAARIGAVVLGIGFQACLAWFLGPEGRGAYAVCIVYSSVLSVVFAYGLDGATQYFLAAGRVSVDRGVSALLILEGISSVLGVAVGLAALGLPFAFFDKAEPRAFLLAVLTFPPQMACLALLLLLGSRREFTFQAILTVARMGVRVVLVVVLVWGLGLAVEGALLANLAGFAVTAAATLVFLRHRHGFRWVLPDLALIREFFGYGARYYLAAFSMLVNAQVGAIMVAFLATVEQVGLFHAGTALTMYVVMVSDVVGAVIHPRIAADRGGRPELAAQGARVVGMLAASVLALMAVVADPLVRILLSPDFLPVVPVIRILAIGIAFRAGTKVLVHYFNATDRPEVFSIATVVGMIGNFALLLVLLPRFGLPGAAWAMTLAFLLNGSVLLIAFRRQSGLRLVECWLPRRADLEIVRDGYEQFRRRRSGK